MDSTIPRGRAMLAPGHSQLDWMRKVRLDLASSNFSATSVRTVTLTEVAKHNRVDDAWMVLKGKVSS
jgi:cytochrome-b5 reductase